MFRNKGTRAFAVASPYTTAVPMVCWPSMFDAMRRVTHFSSSAAVFGFVQVATRFAPKKFLPNSLVLGWNVYFRVSLFALPVSQQIHGGNPR